MDEALLTTVDVEAELYRASISASARQAILKAAFEGRLVEQNPSDEPADRLLAKMSEQAASAPADRRTRRPAALAAE